MSSNTMLYALYRMGYHGRATTHGFRGVASTILNESNLFNRDWIERQLAHVERNEVRRAYNAAEWMPDRRRMMQWWADHIATIALGDNKIVPLLSQVSKGQTVLEPPNLDRSLKQAEPLGEQPLGPVADLARPFQEIGCGYRAPRPS
jgi:hypothetical protein